MLEWIATGLILGGLVALAVGAWAVRRLVDELPTSSSRRSWIAILAFTDFFAVAYLAYLAVFGGTHDQPAELIVPTVFFFGGGFVALVASLVRRTAQDMRRIAVLEAESATDALTGHANRRQFERRWLLERMRARRNSLPLSMLVIDVDHFKSINDSFGHSTGDRVLLAVGDTIRSCLREVDVLARYGGEEFAVIAPHTTPEAALKLAERIRATIERQARFARNGEGGRCVTASIGVAGCENATLG